MTDFFRKKLEQNSIAASAPCRIDMGGTLDLPLFYYQLHYLEDFPPSTFTIAVDMRTRVTLSPFKRGWIKVASVGFEPASFPLDEAPFDHPLGIMFAIASYFRIDGVHINIESSSPPKSGLGGSATATVALIKAFSQLMEESLSDEQIVLIGDAIESNLAGIWCGPQDQLAAVYGGVYVWKWPDSPYRQPRFPKERITNDYNSLQEHLLLAYCGKTHDSIVTNERWVQHFLSGKDRKLWVEIAKCTHNFVESLKFNDWEHAAKAMNQEVAIRKQMTPEVLDKVGTRLADAAIECNCGARFTGAGNGGCVWAIGEKEDVNKLRGLWSSIVANEHPARLLDLKIAEEGILIENE